MSNFRKLKSIRRLSYLSLKSVICGRAPYNNEVLALQSRWASYENKVGIVGLYGADELCVHRAPQRRAGKWQSLHIEEICFVCQLGAASVRSNEIIIDVGWAALSSVKAAQTKNFAVDNCEAALLLPADCRGVRVTGMDGNSYVVVANFGDQLQSLDNFGITLSPGEACLVHRP